MRGHEVGHDILLFAGLFVHLLKSADELAVYGVPRLAHFRQNIVGDMLGGNAQLTADVVLAEFPQESPVAVRQQVVKTKTRADEDLFYSGQGAKLFEQREIVPVIDLKVGTGFGVKAAAVPAGTVGQLLFAGRRAELRSRAADIVDVALEIRLLQHLPGLLQNGFVAADLDNAALVEGQRTEIAVPVAAAVGGETETDLPQGGHAAGRIIHGMPGAHVGEGIDIVHFPYREGFGRGILHDKCLPAVGLIETLCLKRIGIGVLQGKALCIGALSLFVRPAHKFVIRQTDGVEDILLIPCLVHSAVNIGDVAHIHTAGQSIRDLHDAALAHSVGDQIGARFQKDGAAHTVRPVVIVGHAPQACLQSAQDDRCLFKCSADQIAVDNHGIVGSFSHYSAGTERIMTAVLFVDRIVIDHGIHVAGRDQKAQAGLPQDRHACRIAPVGLADHSHRIASGLQDTRNNRRPEARVVHIRVAADIYKIQLFNSLRLHVLPAHGQKALRHFPTSLRRHILVWIKSRVYCTIP